MPVERGVAMASLNCCVVYESQIISRITTPRQPTAVFPADCLLHPKSLGLGERWPILNYVIYTGSKGKSKTFLDPKGNDQLVLGANCFSLE